MAIKLDTPGITIREHRLSSILSYSGNASTLGKKEKPDSQSRTGRYYGQCSGCMEGCAMAEVNWVGNAAYILHAPVGCSADISISYVAERVFAASRGRAPRASQFITTNLVEKDAVYGAEKKLKLAAREADQRFKPTVIFILSSCAAGVIGEDLVRISNELESELGYSVIPVFCEGFKSRVWMSGADAAGQGILRHIVKPATKKQDDLINIFTFPGSDRCTPMLKEIGVRANLVGAPMITAQDYAKITEAVASVEICETQSMYIAAGLENNYGVPLLKVHAPWGIDWTDRWLREIARVTNRVEQAESYIAREHARIAEELAELREKLSGTRIHIHGGDAWVCEMANAAKDLGVNLVGITSNHHDVKPDSDAQGGQITSLVEGYGEIENYTVCCKQPYLVMKLLRESHPDLIIVRHTGASVLGTKLGIPTLFEGDINFSIGYEGVLRLGRRMVSTLKATKFFRHVGAHAKLPYTDWWFNEGDNQYFERGGR